MMRYAAICLCLASSPALAMNWEGHDDWMLDFAPAFTLETYAPEARPRPRRSCPVSHEEAAKNRYEQIPLARHNCPPRRDSAEPDR